MQTDPRGEFARLWRKQRTRARSRQFCWLHQRDESTACRTEGAAISLRRVLARSVPYRLLASARREVWSVDCHTVVWPTRRPIFELGQQFQRIFGTAPKKHLLVGDLQVAKWHRDQVRTDSEEPADRKNNVGRAILRIDDQIVGISPNFFVVFQLSEPRHQRPSTPDNPMPTGPRRPDSS